MQFKTFDIIPHNTKFDFVGKRHIAVILSLVANAAVLLWGFGFGGIKYGVDFAGGTEMEVRFTKAVDPADIRHSIQEAGLEDASVQTYGPEAEHTYLIRVGRIALITQADVDRVAAAVGGKFPLQGKAGWNQDAGDRIELQFQGAPPTTDQLKAAVEGAGIKVKAITEEKGLAAGSKAFTVITQGIQDKVSSKLAERFADASPRDSAGNVAAVQRVEYVGPAVGKELRNQGLKAILYAMALIVVYVGLRFDFRFSPGVIIALLHDAIITLGFFAFTGREFNLTSVAVILTVVGYSVNDTVVVYDRIRENQSRLKGKELGDLVNLSINEVLGRTFLTSFATALSLVGLLIYGVGTIFDFSAAMLVGIISGTYSTWFIAAPMTIWLEDRAERKKKEAAAHPQSSPARAAR